MGGKAIPSHFGGSKQLTERVDATEGVNSGPDVSLGQAHCPIHSVGQQCKHRLFSENFILCMKASGYLHHSGI